MELTPTAKAYTAADVRRIRKSLGMTVVDFARLTGASPAAVCDWERRGCSVGAARRVLEMVESRGLSLPPSEPESVSRRRGRLRKVAVSDACFRFMFDREFTLSEMGAVAGVSKERVRQLLGCMGLRRTMRERGAITREANIPVAVLREVASRCGDIHEVAVAIGKKYNTVYSHMRTAGVRCPDRYAELKARVVERYAMVGSTAEVARELGCSQSFVHAHLVRIGVITPAPRRKRRWYKVPDELLAEIKSRLARGCTQDEVSASLSRSYRSTSGPAA